MLFQDHFVCISAAWDWVEDLGPLKSPHPSSYITYFLIPHLQQHTLPSYSLLDTYPTPSSLFCDNLPHLDSEIYTLCTPSAPPGPSSLDHMSINCMKNLPPSLVEIVLLQLSQGLLWLPHSGRRECQVLFHSPAMDSNNNNKTLLATSFSSTKPFYLLRNAWPEANFRFPYQLVNCWPKQRQKQRVWRQNKLIR